MFANAISSMVINEIAKPRIPRTMFTAFGPLCEKAVAARPTKAKIVDPNGPSRQQKQTRFPPRIEISPQINPTHQALSGASARFVLE